MWTYEAFVREAELLVARSTAQRADAEQAAVWEWRHGARTHLPGNSFLVSRENPRRMQRDRLRSGSASEVGGGATSALDSAIGDINALLEEDHAEMDDQAILSPLTGSDAETVLFEFHIVFHAVYQTPVLYFRLSQLDGAPVAFHGELARELRLPGGDARAVLVAMEDHPVLGTPFYLLHPCETASAMALLLRQPAMPAKSLPASATSAAAPTYLLAWLSFVQPLTHINPLMY